MVAATIGITGFTQSGIKKQELQTITFKVSGNCEMCKERIENSLDVPGVKYAEWDKDKGVVSVQFNTDKHSIASLQQKVTDVGHDTELFLAKDETYNKLPMCCKYRK